MSRLPTSIKVVSLISIVVAGFAIIGEGFSLFFLLQMLEWGARFDLSWGITNVPTLIYFGLACVQMTASIGCLRFGRFSRRLLFRWSQTYLCVVAVTTGVTMWNVYTTFLRVFGHGMTTSDLATELPIPLIPAALASVLPIFGAVLFPRIPVQIDRSRQV